MDSSVHFAKAPAGNDLVATRVEPPVMVAEVMHPGPQRSINWDGYASLLA